MHVTLAMPVTMNDSQSTRLPMGSSLLNGVKLRIAHEPGRLLPFAIRYSPFAGIMGSHQQGERQI